MNLQTFPLCLVGPEVLCLNSTVEGETLADLCNVTGNPEPVVTWFRDGKVVDSTVSLSRGYSGAYVIEAEGASLVRKELWPAVNCEYPATSALLCCSSGAALPGNVCFCSQMNRSSFVRKFTRRWSTLLTISRAWSRVIPNLS